MCDIRHAVFISTHLGTQHCQEAADHPLLSILGQCRKRDRTSAPTEVQEANGDDCHNGDGAKGQSTSIQERIVALNVEVCDFK